MQMKLTEREIELIDGMIEVQKNHAARCDTIQNRTMAEKQKGWDLERVALLEKIKADLTSAALDGEGRCTCNGETFEKYPLPVIPAKAGIYN